MGLSASSAAGGATVTYVTTKLQCATTCIFTSHFCGTLMGQSSSACLSINGVSTLVATSTGYAHNIMCNVFLPIGKTLCAAQNVVDIFGCLIG